MRPITITVVTILCLVSMPEWGLAYPVQNAASLPELEREADFICKATAVAITPVKDEWFTPVSGFEPRAVELKVISVLKGTAPAATVRFHCYVPADKPGFMMYMPQHYRFTVGRTYLVFAKQTSQPGVYRQLWKDHRTKEDQGLFLATTKELRAGATIREAVWAELTGLLQSKEPGDVVYAIRQLDELSGGSYCDLQDFDREKVLRAIQPFLQSPQDNVAKQAITALGSRNPYMSEDFAVGWVATVGHGHIPGYAHWDMNKEYLGAKLFWKELASVVEEDTRLDIRVMAIRALGRSGREEVFDLAKRWVKSSEPEIRQAAALLLAGFPAKVNHDTLRLLAKDPSPLARRSAAQAIAFGRFGPLVPVLGDLLHDADPKVASAAALSLLSFSLDESREILKANLDRSPFSPLFVNALARENPEPYLERLADVIYNDPKPEHWWGGRIPWGVSWDILFAYVQRQPAEMLRNGRLDKLLNALEHPASSGPGGTHYSSSSEPRDLYALYLQCGLTDRAKTFRATCKKSLSYNIDQYFNMVDKNPSRYDRRFYHD